MREWWFSIPLEGKRLMACVVAFWLVGAFMILATQNDR